MDFQLNPKKLPFPNNITVSNPKGPGQLVIVWDPVRNPDENQVKKGSKIPSLIKEVKYNVYRGNSIGGIFYKLNSHPLNIPRFEDSNVNRNPNSNQFYKISTIAILNDGITKVEGTLSGPVMFHIPTTNKWFQKMNERNLWILKNTGVLMDLYRRKTDGERCSCFDQIREQGDPDCTKCFGTTFDGGYEPMMQIYVRQKPTQNSLDLTQQGYVYNSKPGGWTITKIPLSNRDLLFNPQGDLLSVTSVNTNHAAGYLFHQELQLQQLDPMDKRHQIKRKTLYPDL
ncbi:hypothetical protein D3C81_893710 [compost metagenome]